jgi:hypothetical protein
MKKAHKKTLAIAIPLCLLIITFILLLKHVQNNLFKPEVYRDPNQAMQFIRSKMNLMPLWDEFEIGKRNGRILELIGVRGVMQRGSHFYVKVQYGTQDLNDLMNSIDSSKIHVGEYRADHIGIDVKGQKYYYHVLGGADGPVSFMIVDNGDTNIVHYYAYGGDGG